ncbi:MAG: RNA polymerase sigma factor [Nanoarchaeota archaeon]
MIDYVEEMENMRKKMYNLAGARYKISLEDSEDIFQDIVLRLINGNGSSFKGRSKFSTWFYTCFINRCLNHLRGLKRRKEIRLSDLEMDVIDIVNNKDDSDEDSKAESYKVQKQVDGLDTMFKDIVKMRYWDDMKYREIAEKLDIPINTVKTRLWAARRDLKKLLTEDNKNGIVNRKDDKLD